MLDQLLDNFGNYMHTNPWMALGAIFLGGVITAASPCVLAMIPLMMGFVAGHGDEKPGIGRAFGLSMVFILGLSLTFTLLGVVAALAGKMYGDVSVVWKWIVFVVCMVMGLHLMGILKFTIPVPFNIKPKLKGFLGAFILGLLFGVVSTPCAAPVLVVVLAYIPGSGSSVAYGGLLLLVYALGHSVLILVAGTSMGAARKLLESKKISRITMILQRIAGGLIVLVGIYFFHQAVN